MKSSRQSTPGNRRFVYLLNIAQQSVERWIRDQGDGATSARSGVLMALVDDDEGMLLSDVSGALGISPSTLSGLVDRMAQSGLVVRVPDKSDRRAWRLKLTDQGRTARAISIKKARELNALLTRDFTEDELDVVSRWLLSVQGKFREG